MPITIKSLNNLILLLLLRLCEYIIIKGPYYFKTQGKLELLSHNFKTFWFIMA